MRVHRWQKWNEGGLNVADFKPSVFGRQVNKFENTLYLLPQAVQIFSQQGNKKYKFRTKLLDY